jgi:hypothetical protein
MRSNACDTRSASDALGRHRTLRDALDARLRLATRQHAPATARPPTAAPLERAPQTGVPAPQPFFFESATVRASSPYRVRCESDAVEGASIAVARTWRPRGTSALACVGQWDGQAPAWAPIGPRRGPFMVVNHKKKSGFGGFTNRGASSCLSRILMSIYFVPDRGQGQMAKRAAENFGRESPAGTRHAGRKVARKKARRSKSRARARH